MMTMKYSLQGFARFKEELGRLPDIVVLSSAFWDLARWVEHYPSLVAADSLGHLMLAAWAQQLSDVMQMVEVSPQSSCISWHLPRASLLQQLGWLGCMMQVQHEVMLFEQGETDCWRIPL